MNSYALFHEYWAIIRDSKSRMRCLKGSLALLAIIVVLLAVRGLTGFGHEYADVLYGLVLALLVPVVLMVAYATGLDPSTRVTPPLHDEIFSDLSQIPSD